MNIDSIDPQPSEKHAVYFDPLKTQVTIQETVSRDSRPPSPSDTFQLVSDDIGGLSGHIATINRALAHRMGPVRTVSNHRLLGATTLLIHGPEGSGKSLLLERIAACPWKKVFHVNIGTQTKGQAKTIIDTFDDARDNQPSLILMDNLDTFLEKAENLVDRLRTELANLKGTEVVVAAAARSIHDVDVRLQTSCAFKHKLEIFAPGVHDREDIFRKVLGSGCKLDLINIPELAERTHGFVGRDIEHLCSLARNRRIEQVIESLKDDQLETLNDILEKTDFVTQDDFEAVIDEVHPTVLRESILEVPKVRWADIAGVGHVRALLEKITVRPIKVSISPLIFTKHAYPILPTASSN